MFGKMGTDSEQNQSLSDDRQLIEKLLFTTLQEQRRVRRWKVFFRTLFFVWLFSGIGLLLFTMQPDEGLPEEYVALVEINGVIASDQDANADSIASSLRTAFEDDKVKAVILRINSPGGSPVQASYIYNEIDRLKELHKNVKVYAVISDMGASAAYYIASAADEIYADESSVVGSIGAYMASFGFVDAMQKIGVTRRFYGAGEHKALTDPFQPEDPTAATHLRRVVADIHDQFIAKVKEGRGDRLVNDPLLFTGLIWSGAEAKGLGLVDGLGSASYVAREIIKVEEIVDFSLQPNFLERFAHRVGASMATTLGASFGLNGVQLR